ncbi:hypothetical protein [Marilutibacter chinensis]|uniref:Integral membrane protein n=1 Tax=Marilutibacter chinensis TaxID=2912247 RepID=A0ABS9HRW9_9GAMM|nr:hypothetical protein [Lysobacter chinensis]MCF7221100.1 hypothetical protein [Lysobacter chinensis]
MSTSPTAPPRGRGTRTLARRAVRAALAGCLAGCLVVACSGRDHAVEEHGTQLMGVLLDAQMSEISGLAVSRRHPGVIWMHDDGGNPERLFATDESGTRLATFRVEGVTKTDWEDMASFELDGTSYLLVADTGDNGGLRRSLQLHVFEEPETLENARLTPAWSIAFRWPDGARDCEAVAVDAAGGQVLLVSKKRTPPELFSLPLRPYGTGLQTASPIGALAGVPAPATDLPENAPRRSQVEHQVTAADVSPDGRTLAVMTYKDLLFYSRIGAENWGQAVSRAPVLTALPWLPQAEAMGWNRDGSGVFTTGEFIPAPLYLIGAPSASASDSPTSS